MLSDSQIRHALRWRSLQIDPFRDDHVQAASYDVCLHPRLLVLLPGGPIDPKFDTTDQWRATRIPPGGFLLKPGQFVLGSTLERISLGDGLLGQLEGRSSLGRLGLMVHSTAGYLDPGFAGQVTLELSCTHSRGILLHSLMPIGQIAFDNALAVEHPYQGKYQGQEGPTASANHLNWLGSEWR